MTGPSRPRPYRGRVFPLDRATALYGEGYSADQIAVIIGYSFSATYKRLVRAGVLMRRAVKGRSLPTPIPVRVRTSAIEILARFRRELSAIGITPSMVADDVPAFQKARGPP